MTQHWTQKNNREWTEEEITQHIIAHAGRDVTRPVGNNLLIKLCTKPEKTKSGIILPSDFKLPDKSYSRFGIVLDMGKYAYQDPVKWHKGPLCYIGDTVTFRQFEWESIPPFCDYWKETSNFSPFDNSKNENYLVIVPCNMITTTVESHEEFIL